MEKQAIKHSADGIEAMTAKARLPPRIDASPEEIARAALTAPRQRVEYREYRCQVCGVVVEWPVVL